MDLSLLFQDALADDQHGATDIERCLTRRLLEHRENWNREILCQGALLISEHSSMVNLRRLGMTLMGCPTLEEIERRLSERQVVLDQLSQLFALAGFDLVMRYSRVVTISRSSAVEAVLIGAFERGWSGRVVVLDGTPTGCGPDQAGRLAAVGLSVRSIPDGAMVDALRPPYSETLVLVGADAVGPHRIVNAQGTGLLLETAGRRDIHTTVVADTGKEIEETVIDQLLEAGRKYAEPGWDRGWPVLESFPRALVRERLNESGRHSA